MNQFDVIRLGYESLNVKQVMDWYDQNSPPFGPGKRKEFPDAISIAILADYAEKNGCFVAVVAGDTDFEAACKRYSSLLYFKSLPSLTELLISSDDDRVTILQKAIEDDTDILEDAVYSEVLDTVDLYHEGSSGGYFHLEDGHRDFEQLSIHGVSVVAVGSNEATVTFDAVVNVKFRLAWEERGSDDHPEFEYRDLEEEADISGTAKLSFNETTKKVTGATFVELDSSEIELRVEPLRWITGRQTIWFSLLSRSTERLPTAASTLAVPSLFLHRRSTRVRRATVVIAWLRSPRAEIMSYRSTCRRFRHDC